MTRSFPGADVGSDHDVVMTNFSLRLKRLKFDLENLKAHEIIEAFQAMIGGKCATLAILEEENIAEEI